MRQEYKLVPVDATADMIAAGMKVYGATARYNAMLAAAPAPLGMEVEVLAWYLPDEDGKPDATVRGDVAKHVPEAFPLVDRAHIARLQAENAALQQRLSVADQRVDELTLNSFQQRVRPWMAECFGPEVLGDEQERNHRFIEEALELIQACGATASEAHQLVDYVYGRPVGDKIQEIGGVMVTLAALCLAHGLNMHIAGETELQRIWTKVDQIRGCQKFCVRA
ncbi:hypothetical protein [Pseudomonas sp. LP_7_YM]|uniref:hypothetical protein n=1 Tax=Pseudomonas sp. LP_7_YM TaxID=2485137 RepID=UPI0010DAD4CC|nr:hypothetical protein [Pseudomonas sp. LP_7_YM]TDV60145.1 hypothetical protein EC915_113110 [Pseudomonas sp. LP_7_YM]